MTVPLFRSLAAPLRSVSVTWPDVVGVHVRGAGCPAVTMKPDETVGGFGPVLVCATTAASRQARVDKGAKRMMTSLGCVFSYKELRLKER